MTSLGGRILTVAFSLANCLASSPVNSKNTLQSVIVVIESEESINCPVTGVVLLKDDDDGMLAIAVLFTPLTAARGITCRALLSVTGSLYVNTNSDGFDLLYRRTSA